MTQTVLAADIGATKSDLAIFALQGDRTPTLVREAQYPSHQFNDLESMIQSFLGGDAKGIAAASVGVAGPVVDGAAVGTNLPWVIQTRRIESILGAAPVRLMNDLEATAYGTLFLSQGELQTLRPGVVRDGNRAVIAAGTGLGQAFLFWDGKRYIPSATEGGHADFAPRDEIEERLLRFLRKEYPRVSYERVLSGPGLYNVFRFLTEVEGGSVNPRVAERLTREDPNAVVGQAGVSGDCTTCEKAVEMFVSIYGAQAGNLALTVMATGGVYVGGGIVTKMVAKMTSGLFTESFLAKGRYVDFMNAIPIHILLNAKTALIGAAHAAKELAAG